MRMIVQVTFPHAKFNAAVKDGSVGAKMQKILAEIKPEAVYFTEFSGHRTGILIVNLEDASKIPSLAEPFFLTFEADVRIHPIMSAEDLGRSGLEALGKKWA